MHESPEQNVESGRKEIFPTGTRVVLRKVNIQAGARSEVGVGEEFRGALTAPIIVGDAIYVESGNTGAVKDVYVNGGRTFVETPTSVYELIVEQEKFTGLEMKSELGNVVLPFDARVAELGEEVVHARVASVREPGTLEQIYINKPKLQGTIIETGGAEVFGAEDRLMLLARVGNIHLPFYISSNGTSGKRKGEWYPFFGLTDARLIKGNIVEETGDMQYHPEIDRVRKLLNENLVIPGISSKTGEPALVAELEKFSLGEQLRFRSTFLDYMALKKEQGPQAAQAAKDDTRYVEVMTGYGPDRTITSEDGRGTTWMKSILAQIENP